MHVLISILISSPVLLLLLFSTGGTPLKGFQLWLAENKHSLEGDTDTEISTNGLSVSGGGPKTKK